MQDVITTSPVTIRRSYLPRVMLPHLGIGATAVGLIKAMGTAINMAYVAPCGNIRYKKAAPDVADLDGRDPDW